MGHSIVAAAGYYDDFEVGSVVKVEMDPNGPQAQLNAEIAPVADRLLKRYKLAQANKAHSVSQQDKTAIQDFMAVLSDESLFYVSSRTEPGSTGNGLARNPYDGALRQQAGAHECVPCQLPWLPPP